MLQIARRVPLLACPAVLAAIQYIHENPIRRKHCQCVLDWTWSSARWYADLTEDSSLAKLTSLPPHFFDSTG
jgi:putative transposase